MVAKSLSPLVAVRSPHTPQSPTLSSIRHSLRISREAAKILAVRVGLVQIRVRRRVGASGPHCVPGNQAF